MWVGLLPLLRVGMVGLGRPLPSSVCSPVWEKAVGRGPVLDGKAARQEGLTRSFDVDRCQSSADGHVLANNSRHRRLASVDVAPNSADRARRLAASGRAVKRTDHRVLAILLTPSS